MLSINEKLEKYFKSKNITKISKAGKIVFTCPRVKEHKFPSRNPTAEFLPNSDKISCLICGFKGTVYDYIRTLEEDYKNKSDAEISIYLDTLLDIGEYKEFDIYGKYNWELLPLLKNSKDPIQGEKWKENHYKDKISWIKWMNNGLNFGLKTGETNNIIAIDVDNKPITDENIIKQRVEIINILESSNTLKARSARGGFHYIFKFDKDIPQKVNIAGLHIDTRCEGGYVAIFPSKFEGAEYKWLNLGNEIKEISLELKTKLIELSNKIQEKKITEPEIKVVKEGDGRNSTLTSIGGALINKFDADDVAYILSLISKNFMNPPLPFHEIKGMLGSLSGYKISEDETQEKSIYNYMKQMQTDITPKDVIDNTHYSRAIIDKWLSKFVKEGKAVRLGRGRYQYKEKITWSKESGIDIEECKIKIPYFNDIAIFQDADCLILGGKTNEGKTTIALNMMKEFIAQGITPYYLYTEAGSRFIKTAKALGIDGKYYHYQHSNPLAIELEPNAVTVIDWLFLENKAETDTVLKHINDELQRKRGILIIFSQLKQDYSWFAPNLIDHFPTFAARYIQEDEMHTTGHWQCDKVKEAKPNFNNYPIPCEYNKINKIFQLKNLI